MADPDDIVINLKSDISEGEAAKRKLEDISRATKELNDSFAAGNGTLASYRAELKNLEREAGRAQAALDRFNDAQIRSGGQRVTGSARAGAKARLGLAAANIAQDVIQGGPAAGINNILGLGNDPKALALLREFVEGAGGVSGLASKLGAVGAAAAALFVTLDQGLKSAKLEWSDLDDVAGNLAPFQAARELFEGLGEVAKDWHLDAAWKGASEAASGYVNAIADATLGWNSATEAARAHKEEVQRGMKATQDYADAAKALASVRSDDQQEQQRRGKLVGQELANLGGSAGINAVIDKLARDATRHGSDDKVDAYKLDDKGRATSEPEQITRRESMRRTITTDIASAAAGDVTALERLRPYLKSSGFDLGGVNSAAGGLDSKKAAEAADKESGQLMQERIREAERHVDDVSREYQRRASELAKPLQERFNKSSASGVAVNDRQVQGKLEAAGVGADEARKMARAVLEVLQDGFREEIRGRAGKLGTDAEGAKGSILADAAAGAERDRDAARRTLGLDKVKPSEVINGAAQLRDLIQASVGKDDIPQRSLAVQEQARDALNRSNDLLQTIARRVGGPARVG